MLGARFDGWYSSVNGTRARIQLYEKDFSNLVMTNSLLLSIHSANFSVTGRSFGRDGGRRERRVHPGRL